MWDQLWITTGTSQGIFQLRELKKCTDTLTFISHDIPISSFTLEDFLVQALDDIVTILQSEKSPLPPTFQMGDPTRQDLLDIATTLKSSVKPPPSSSISLPPTILPHAVSEPRGG